ncbi:MAG: FAD-dependent oxidoreductase [Candidatus Nanopelagicales bacterium]
MKADGVVVIVGAGIAGFRVAEELRAQGHRGKIVLLGAERNLPYNRPPLSKAVLQDECSPLPVLATEGEIADLRIDFRSGTSAVRLDPRSSTVSLADGSLLGYDSLVIATGSHPRLLRGAAPGPGLHVLRTFEDARRISQEMKRDGRLVVIGGGFIGCEVAASARQAGVEVALVEALSTPLQMAVGSEVGHEVAAMHRAHGVDLHCDSLVTNIVGDGSIEGVELSTGEFLPTSTVVIGLGITPSTEWLAGSGVVETDGVLCDASGRTSELNIYAVGDVANWQTTDGRGGRREHWTSATDQARIVATNILLADEDAPAELNEPPYFWSDMYGSKLQALGWPSGSCDQHALRKGASESNLVMLYGRNGFFEGIVGIDVPRVVMATRRLLQEKAGFDEAIATVSAL